MTAYGWLPNLGQFGWGHSYQVRFCSPCGHPKLVSYWGLEKVTKGEGRLHHTDECVDAASNLKCPLYMAGVVTVSEPTTALKELET